MFADNNDFSVNQYIPTKSTPSRYPGMCFNDGNIAVLAGQYYFLVHQVLLCRHSPALDSAIKALDSTCSPAHLEGRPVLHLNDGPDEMYHFLSALYDGVSHIKYTNKSFSKVASLLRLCTHYQVGHLRQDLLRGLSATWPTTLEGWDAREADATNVAGLYESREKYPHPILVINLSCDISAQEILPSAFYDLSRSPPSSIVEGFKTSGIGLSSDCLMSLLKGKERASRFLSTFIVKQLERRAPASKCIHRQQLDTTHQRACQAAFEAITFEILRGANGVVCHRSSDPLFAIMDAELIQTTYDKQNTGLRPCKYCRSEFSSIVKGARTEFWRLLPEWFGIDVPSWD
ncbi:uncharacterized protein BT62DRAFT_124122 [Guyanagaster necrorhizus]|uniref:BTB domain-containing protein n=1 Tax=Guyanagaster necrorhizus TaxID=856835 RepID=A0A9P7VUS7_9AGAR|nr:uncharacterized protein BT62DRAFT_124122 [Guyanagaster necrorhizus MCA 3950]KAG7446519.1 hypothetical protein BT62DRAFT_124122 [Guyanagaster necrorhizus MCA 3950]